MAPEASDSDVEVKPRGCLPYQAVVEDFYDSTSVQIGVAVIIGANFLTNIVEKQIDPYEDVHEGLFNAFELIYNFLFTIELAVNMYGKWWCRFWKSGWNIFDVIVVTIGLVTTFMELPKALGLLRTMRAFRVFRLFKRVKSLNKIILAIARAVPGVRDTFIILAIVMAIYAILAVEFYKDVGMYCHDPLSEDRWWLTARGHCMGEEYFGKFSKSLYSFFQVMTGESWSEAVARPAIWYYEDQAPQFIGSFIFFVTYLLVVYFVLLNVVATVLLDKMVDPEEPKEEVPEEEDPDAVDSIVSDTKLEVVAGQVKKLSGWSGNMRTNINSARTDMASLQDQVNMILKAVQDRKNVPAPTSPLREA